MTSTKRERHLKFVMRDVKQTESFLITIRVKPHVSVNVVQMCSRDGFEEEEDVMMNDQVVPELKPKLRAQDELIFELYINPQNSIQTLSDGSLSGSQEM